MTLFWLNQQNPRHILGGALLHSVSLCYLDVETDKIIVMKDKMISYKQPKVNTKITWLGKYHQPVFPHKETYKQKIVRICDSA